MLKWITLAPLIGAIINGLLGRRFVTLLGQRVAEKLTGFIACVSVGVSTALAFIAFFGKLLPLPEGQRLITEHFFTWIKVGSFQADFAYMLDPLSGVYILFVTGVGLLIHIYSIGYMRGDPGYYRFFAYMNLFMFMMLTLVLADNLLLLFVGWEGVGLCSYLLIGYYIRWDVAGSAAIKAFIANRIGDFGYLIATFIVFTTFGTISFVSKNGMAGFTEQAKAMPVEGWMAFGVLTTIALLFFAGSTGKSAQIPLYVWLPDAMAGPTPVSALIHAATMVTAGVYLTARISAIYVKAPTALAIVAVIGAVTALFAATIGLAQNDIKKVLAYSTISQLGYMFLACGVGAFAAGIFHVITHAFFKALLFLGSGSVIHGANGEQDMRWMGGLRKYMPITFSTMLAGWLAISGVPLFSGFFSKDEIMWRAWSTDALPHIWGRTLWAIVIFTALLTSVYMTRLMWMTFWGSERFREPHDDSGSRPPATDTGAHHGEPHESGPVMTIPLIILAMLSIVGGYIGVPPSLGGTNYFEHLLEPVISKAEPVASIHAGSAPATTQTESHGVAPAPESQGAVASQAAHEGGHDFGTELIFTAISSAVAVLGILFGIWFFNRRPLWRAPKLLEDKYRVDELYDATIVEPVIDVSRYGLWKVVDVKIIDGFVNGVARVFAGLAGLLRHTQTGLARNYAAVILIGAIIVIGYFGFVALR